MSLNVISNYAANVAHRNLMTSDSQATSSLAKLSSGSRVVSAKDDAAAMAIGARLNSTVNALKQASVNAGQGVSMLQIADGAMARVNDVLVRMKTLSVQAGSGQLSSTERGMLDTEYQSLVSEVTRIAAATDFNGQQLVNGSLTTVQTSNTSSAFLVADGVASITAHGLTASTSDNYTLSYDGTTGHTFTLTGPGGTSYTGQISSSAYDSSSAMSTGTAVKLTAANTSSVGDIVISLNTAFDAATTVAASTNNGMHFTGSDTTSFSYKVGAGTDATKDVITVSVNGINAANLGLTGTDITTAATADAASDLISAAIDTLNTARSTVGAYQNRLQFASDNLASAIENSEAARSNLLDLDIAQEMTTFTSKQILTQAGVSMLAQANQMPQNLLKLFQ
ncbi:flagellin [Hypericibacter adhaerens]|uniref:Flagellin n=1 Tax=Hypericibacter adhaerens TaxID=2602016 RepID=A0A5J6N1I3_9PROT|nr:flagellin [Hypericibacter adhaerens]QEX23551.1 flagellin [Hypericibacter adhaerens]